MEYRAHAAYETNAIYRKCNTLQYSTVASVYNIMKIQYYARHAIYQKYYMIKYAAKAK